MEESDSKHLWNVGKFYLTSHSSILEDKPSS
jgi:hypothetical protein